MATSYEGNCPHRNNGNGPEGQDFEFKVPSDIEPGVIIFAWIWYNREQEFNMNCAAVSITSKDSSADPPAPSVYSSNIAARGYPRPVLRTNNDCYCHCGLSSNISNCDCECSASSCDTLPEGPRPVYPTENNCSCHCEAPSDISTCDCDCPGSCPNKAVRSEESSLVKFNDRPRMFVADDGNGCLTPHTTAELKYPVPGPDIVTGDGAYPLVLPTGECGQSQMLSKQGYNGANGNDGH